MELRKYTSEAVSPGHPDKMADQIAAHFGVMLTEMYGEDTRYAIEVLAGHGLVRIIIETNIDELDEYHPVLHDLYNFIYATINYNRTKQMKQGPDYQIEVAIAKQSAEIAKKVDSSEHEEQGAGDQGITTAYYYNDGYNGWRWEHALAKRLCRFLYEKQPADGKTQVTVDTTNKTLDLTASWCGVPSATLSNWIDEWTKLDKALKYLTRDSKEWCATIHANPNGDWSIGGFDADAGVTGRKLACDFYGANVPIGGGNLHGKDFTKADVTGNLYAHYMAVERNQGHNVVWQYSWTIGDPEPVESVAKGTPAICDSDNWVGKGANIATEMIPWCRKNVNLMQLAMWGLGYNELYE